MKATGIVRRIDDLGRVVIPKEIRRTMRIREGDPLEIYTDREGEVIFKKYSPIGEMTNFASQYAETLNKVCNIDVVICDRDAVVAAAGVPKKEYLEKSLSSELEVIMQGRGIYRSNPDQKVYVTKGEENDSRFVSYAMPIVSDGDTIGCVVFLTDTERERKKELSSTELEIKLIMTAAGFLGKQMES